MSEIVNSWLDQYGTELFEQQQFGTAGIEGVKKDEAMVSEWGLEVESGRTSAQNGTWDIGPRKFSEFGVELRAF